MAKVTFKPYPQYETLLLPPSLSELIPATHPVRLVNAVLDKIDISELKSTYVGGGASSYNPRMLLKVIVYGYLCNIYSGRQLEKVITENINFMWLAGMSRPDFRTINLFRSKRLKNGVFEKIFVRVVKLDVFGFQFQSFLHLVEARSGRKDCEVEVLDTFFTDGLGDRVLGLAVVTVGRSTPFVLTEPLEDVLGLADVDLAVAFVTNEVDTCDDRALLVGFGVRHG